MLRRLITQWVQVLPNLVLLRSLVLLMLLLACNSGRWRHQERLPTW